MKLRTFSKAKGVNVNDNTFPESITSTGVLYSLVEAISVWMGTQVTFKNNFVDLTINCISFWEIPQIPLSQWTKAYQLAAENKKNCKRIGRWRCDDFLYSVIDWWFRLVRTWEGKKYDRGSIPELINNTAREQSVKLSIFFRILLLFIFYDSYVKTYAEGIEKLVPRYDKCLNLSGDYVEK